MNEENMQVQIIGIIWRDVSSEACHPFPIWRPRCLPQAQLLFAKFSFPNGFHLTVIASTTLVTKSNFIPLFRLASFTADVSLL